MLPFRSWPTLAVSLAVLAFVAWLSAQGSPSGLYLTGPMHG